MRLHIATQLNLRPEQVTATVELLDAGNTLPFIARYRKEVTGGLDEEQIRQLSALLTKLRKLEERRRTIVASIEVQGQLTPELHQRLLEADSLSALEDLYRSRLAELAHGLDDVAHLRRLRLHTRLPIVLPERVHAGLLDWLGATRLRTVVVVHANHANEIDTSVRAALARLKDANVELLNQSVLLRGVNDSVEALAALSEVMFEAGVLPYYLHMLDRVQGAAHFEVRDDTARSLMAELNGRLPGYLVPRLVREIPGAPGKLSAA